MPSIMVVTGHARVSTLATHPNRSSAECQTLATERPGTTGGGQGPRAKKNRTLAAALKPRDQEVQSGGSTCQAVQILQLNTVKSVRGE
jgi:hypothetical protein